MNRVRCISEHSAPTRSLHRDESSIAHDVSTRCLRCRVPYEQKWTLATSSWELLRPVSTLGKLRKP